MHTAVAHTEALILNVMKLELNVKVEVITTSRLCVRDFWFDTRFAGRLFWPKSFAISSQVIDTNV
jgi:hypothetical protein